MGKLFLMIIIQGGLLFSQIFPSVKLAGKSYSSTVTEVTIFSTSSNPALLSNGYNSAGISIIPETFGLNELSQKNLGIILKLPGIVFGAEYKNYGFELFRKQIFSVGTSVKVSKNLSAGFSADIDFLRIKNYGLATTKKLNAGLFFIISKKLSFGVALKNFMQTKTSESDISPRSNLLFGITYFPVKNFSCHLQLDKERNREISVAAGIEFSFQNLISLRSGYSDNPDVYSFGISLHIEPVEIEYAVQVHNYLDETQMLGLKINY